MQAKRWSSTAVYKRAEEEGDAVVGVVVGGS